MSVGGIGRFILGFGCWRVMTRNLLDVQDFAQGWAIGRSNLGELTIQWGLSFGKIH